MTFEWLIWTRVFCWRVFFVCVYQRHSYGFPHGDNDKSFVNRIICFHTINMHSEFPHISYDNATIHCPEFYVAVFYSQIIIYFNEFIILKSFMGDVVKTTNINLLFHFVFLYAHMKNRNKNDYHWTGIAYQWIVTRMEIFG